jgi:hypothetical protein
MYQEEPMTERTINAKEGFGRLFVLGGFTLVKQTRLADIATSDMNNRATRQQRSAGVRIVRDVSQQRPNSTTRSRRKKTDDRAAIERGEDEGMLVAPS